MDAIPGRLRWRCRRGMLELDLVLGRFLHVHCAGLTAQQLAEFDALLDLPDQVLWQLVRETQGAATDVLGLLRTCGGVDE
ncbi:MAG: succinate dehydrogenase assembly factor 2 [Sulfuriferula sp.]|nr:succinate dehydrogenase assembly factor 2 [Sulfuriferula sp.]